MKLLTTPRSAGSLPRSLPAPAASKQWHPICATAARRSTTPRTSVSVTTRAIGSPFAASGAARKSVQSSRTRRTVRLGSLIRSCQAQTDLRLLSTLSKWRWWPFGIALLGVDLRHSVESNALPGHTHQVVSQPPDTAFYKTFQVQLMHSVKGHMPKLGQPAFEKSTTEESVLA